MVTDNNFTDDNQISHSSLWSGSLSVGNGLVSMDEELEREFQEWDRASDEDLLRFEEEL